MAAKLYSGIYLPVLQNMPKIFPIGLKTFLTHTKHILTHILQLLSEHIGHLKMSNTEFFSFVWYTTFKIYPVTEEAINRNLSLDI